MRPDPRRRSFAQMPEALLLADISNRAKILWGILDRQARGREIAIDPRPKLAAKLRCSVDSLDRATHELVESGWMGVERRSGWRNRYTLWDDPVLPGQPVVSPEPPSTPCPPADITRSGSRNAAAGHSGDRSPAAGVAAPVRPHTRAVPYKGEKEGEAPPPPPNPQPSTAIYVGRCQAHGNHPSPPPCGGCADARRAHETAQSAQRAAAPAAVKCSTHLLEHAPGAECRSCRADRLAGDRDEPIGRLQMGRRATELAFRALVGLQPSSAPRPARDPAVDGPQPSHTGVSA